MRQVRRLMGGWSMAGLLLVGTACGTAPTERSTPSDPATTSSAAPAQAEESSSPTPGSGPSSSTPGPTTTPSSAAATPNPEVEQTPSEPPSDEAVLASDGRPREARLSIPALDIEDLRVRPYRGRTDDAAGTRIQDRGLAASPYGPNGGVGPGGIGNYLVTGHRLSSTRAFLDLPDLDRGDRVVVEAGGKRYTYRIVQTRITSFRSAASLRRQAAEVPGRPGVTATEAMITLSTCRTPEDHAEGNYWSDRFGNPEHRIDKIGRLVSITDA